MNKKVFSGILAVVLVLTMCVSAFASEWHPSAMNNGDIEILSFSGTRADGSKVENVEVVTKPFGDVDDPMAQIDVTPLDGLGKGYIKVTPIKDTMRANRAADKLEKELKYTREMIEQMVTVTGIGYTINGAVNEMYHNALGVENTAEFLNLYGEDTAQAAQKAVDAIIRDRDLGNAPAEYKDLNNYVPVMLFDVCANQQAKDDFGPGGKAELEIKVSGMKESSMVITMHLKDDETTEFVPTVPGEGKAKFTVVVDDLSPFVMLAYVEPVPAKNGGGWLCWLLLLIVLLVICYLIYRKYKKTKQKKAEQ